MTKQLHSRRGLEVRSAAMLLAASLVLPAAASADRVITKDVDPAALVQPHPVMTSDYYYLVQQLGAASKSQRDAMQSSGHAERVMPIFVLKGDNLEWIETTISLRDWDDVTRKALNEAGVEVIVEDPDRLLVQAWVPLARVEEVAALAGVRELRRPSYGIPAAQGKGIGGETTTDPIITEGDANLGTNLIRNNPVSPVNGAGIRVGVISSGLYSSRFPETGPAEGGANADVRVASSEIPRYPVSGSEPAPISGYLGAVQIFPASHSSHVVNLSQGQPSLHPVGTEGAAILETLHDIAPAAQLFYGDGRTDVSLASSRNFLRQNGVSVIVDNMIFVDAGRFDGTSAISRAAQSMVLNDNIVYVVAGGDYTPPPHQSTGNPVQTIANRFPLFVNGFFSPDSSQGVRKYHNFASGRALGVRDEYLLISSQLNAVPDSTPVGVVDVVLVWDDRWSDTNPGAMDDLDLLLYTVTNNQIGELVASSSNLQTARNPVERITYFDNVFSTRQYALAIRRKDGFNNSPRLFTLAIIQGVVNGTDVQYLTHGVPMNNADALRPVVSVGAIDAELGTNTVASTTVPGLDPGPGRALTKSFVKWFENQQSPAVVSYSNTRTLSMGEFLGTSASAAHIGGLVALLRHAFPEMPAYQYYDVLRDTTPEPTDPFPNATPLNTDVLSQFQRAPVYLRVNGYDTWNNIRLYGAKSTRTAAPVPTVNANGAWESSPKIEPFDQPVFSETPQGLSISPGGQSFVFGFWQTPRFEFPKSDGTLTTELRTDRVYGLTARVGSDESDPTRVPNFRLRLINYGSNEAVTMDVAGLNAEVANTPTTIGGKTYKLYYRPSNEQVAKEGVRFAFDLVHTEPNDNSNATLYLQEVSMQELQVPQP